MLAAGTTLSMSEFLSMVAGTKRGRWGRAMCMM